jgi:hypothetical protein
MIVDLSWFYFIDDSLLWRLEQPCFLWVFYGVVDVVRKLGDGRRLCEHLNQLSARERQLMTWEIPEFAYLRSLSGLSYSCAHYACRGFSPAIEASQRNSDCETCFQMFLL